MDVRRERRSQRRLELPATAWVCIEGYELGPFAVDNLSSGGALLTGDIVAATGDVVQVLLVLHGQQPLDLDARVIRLDRGPNGMTRLGIQFEHWSAATEDALHEALFGAGSPGKRARDSVVPAFEVDDSDFIPVVPAPRS